MRLRPLTTFIALTLALAMVAGCSVNGELHLPTGVVYPSINPVAGTADLTVTQTFTFEGAPRSVTMVVDGPVFGGAQQAEKSVIRFGKARENDWIRDYYPAFVFDEHQDAFFSALMGQLNGIRSASGLDDDRYVELMTAYVQSLEYRIDPVDLSPKFPVETAGEGAGDCDDKALLLGGMLAREGYDVAILLFSAEQHVALGIKADGLDYRDTGYAYIETTAQGFVGMPPDTIGEGAALSSQPQVIRIGTGKMSWGAGPQVASILDAAKTAEKRAGELAARLKAADTSLTPLQSRTQALKSQLDARSSAGDNAAYNSLVPTYNAAVAEYNAAVAARNQIAQENNGVVAIHTYIVEHLDDRPGAFAWVQSHPL
ncbi:MAG: hypothetical protein CVT66_00700 [Actinobacteria bacterium HGW-Actinobacteria-6]|nr:MAG: hypothetical protein CVT66_00700 [Actinobacteria bacterium HGW-Actinobacteria-6]